MLRLFCHVWKSIIASTQGTSMKNPTLLVLAAGMGSRYNGLKQIDSVGPNGESIIDYSVYDALRAGFKKIVFVIRREFEAIFKEKIGSKYESKVLVEYVFQDLSKVPSWFVLPANRTKPWGTGHAILIGAEKIDGPFAVINGDDFYGADSFLKIGSCLQHARDTDVADYSMVGFVLRNTLSTHGTVSRGVCRIEASNSLEKVTELTKIGLNGDRITFDSGAGNIKELSGQEIVSMNMWGFTPSIFSYLESFFETFLKEHGQEEKSEFFIPTVVDTLIANGTASVNVLRSNDQWFGITYQEDKPGVLASIRSLIDKGIYPDRLW